MNPEVLRLMIAAYIAGSNAAPGFFSGMFIAAPENFHDTEEVELDISRNGQDVSVAIQDLSTGYRYNEADGFSTKAFKPPIHKEAFPINSFDLLKRQFGQNTLDTPDVRATLINKFFQGMRKIDAKVRRAMELQASQVMQTGKVRLTDYDGKEVYELTYGPNAANFPTAATTWGTEGADPMADLEALAESIRDSSQLDPNDIYFGAAAWRAFMADEKIQKLLDIRNIAIGGIERTQKRGNGASFRGTIDIGTYTFNLFTYNAKHKDPQTGTLKPFLEQGNVVMRATDGRLDASFGNIPNIGKLLGQQPTEILNELPGRISDAEGGIDLFTNVWLTPDGEQLFGGVGARPLMIPTAIDSFGCLKTGL